MADAVVLSAEEVAAFREQAPNIDVESHPAPTKPWLSRVWRPERVVESFYSGGTVVLNNTLGVLFCAFDGCVRVVTLEGAVCGSLGEKSDPDSITDFHVDRAGSILVATYSSNLIRIFDVILGAEGRAFFVRFKESRVLKGLDVSPKSVRVDPTRTLVAIGAADGTVAVYDMKRGHRSHELRREDREVSHVRFHPSRPGLLLYATAAGVLRVFDLHRDIIVAECNDHQAAITDFVILLAADSSALGVVVSVGRDHLINVWDLASLDEQYPPGVTAGSAPAAAEVERPFKVRRLRLDPIRQIVTHETLYGVMTASRSELGVESKAPWCVLTCGEECVVKVWDPVSGHLLLSRPSPHLQADGPMTQLVRASEGRFLSVADDRVIGVWAMGGLSLLDVVVGHVTDIFDVQVVRRNAAHHATTEPATKKPAAARSTELSVISLRGDQRIHCFEMDDCDLTTVELRRLRLAERRASRRRQLLDKPVLEGRIQRKRRVRPAEGLEAEYSDDDTSVAFSAEALAQLNQKPEFRPGQQQLLIGHSGMVVCAAVSPDGCWLATGDRRSEIRVWSLRTKVAVAVLSGHSAAVSSLCWSRRVGRGEECSCTDSDTSFGENFFLCSSSEDGNVKRWSVNRNRLRRALLNSSLVDVASPSGSIVAHTKTVNSMDVSRNNAILVTGSQDRLVKVWSLPNMKPLVTCRGHKRGVWSVAISPVDKVAASAASDGLVHLWSVVDGSCLKTLMGHTGAVHSVRFLPPTASRLITTGADRTIKLWSARTAECVGTFEAHDDRVWAAQLVPNADSSLPPTTMVSCGSDGRLVVWKDKSLEEADETSALRAQELRDAHEIENLFKDGKVGDSLRLCLRLRKDKQTFDILERAMGAGFTRAVEHVAGLELEAAAAGAGALPAVHDVNGLLAFSAEEWLLSLDDAMLARLLNLLSLWHSRHSWLASALFSLILQLFSGDELSKLEGFSDFAPRFASLARKHANRLQTLKQKSFLLDVALARSGLVAFGPFGE